MNNKFEQNSIDESKKNKMVAITLSILSIFVLIGIGMAYFSAPVSNTNKEKYSTETATIALKFDDGDNGISGNLNLGESVTKKFTLQNTGTKNAYATINWLNLINTYQPRSLSYVLEQSTSPNGTYTTKVSDTVPSSNAASTVPLARKLLVPINTKYYYKLTITLNNIDVEQNSDISAVMNSKFNIVEDSSTLATTTIQNLLGGTVTNTTSVITKDAPSGVSCTNTFAYDGTIDNNLRYVGADPCNYVTFNGETAGWRIIGIMKNIDDGTGKKETRLKLIRANSLERYSWDSSASSVNSGWGINDWTQADLMRELNGDYLNTSLNANTNWYNGQNNAKTGVFDYSGGLNTQAQSLIRSAKWPLGGLRIVQQNSDALKPYSRYSMERGTEVVGNPSGTCSDEYCPRATEWAGKVALIYASDYGLATAGSGSNPARAQCTSLSMTDWTNTQYVGCRDNDWLKPPSTSYHFWTLSPSSGNSDYGWYINGNGQASVDSVYINRYVFPAVYLDANASITGGNGSQESPYTLN